MLLNRVRRNFYLDSVALMRLSQELGALPGIEAATLMIGSARNKALLGEAGLLADDGEAAAANDLVIAVRARTAAEGEAALAEAERLLDGAGRGGRMTTAAWQPRSIGAALDLLDGANLALISVPGEFAATEARRALARGLHVMLFSDNVAVAEECALKREALDRGLMLMGPDCGTALLGGVPLAFANEVPRGPIGVVAASGTGLQEVTSLIARAGGGVSHGIGVGGRDLSGAVDGLMTLAAIDALDSDPATERIVLVSKPPDQAVAAKVLDRLARSPKPVTVCFLGSARAGMPANARFAPTLRAAAEDALGGALPGSDFPPPDLVAPAGDGRRWIRGLFAGGTLCAEAQVVLRAAGRRVRSNVPVPGAEALAGGDGPAHELLDLGADEYTLGRPHPMIDPAAREEMLGRTFESPDVAVVLLDVVIGHGAHGDPARGIARMVAARERRDPRVVASVCGTEGDPQVYSRQVRLLSDAGVIVAPSNAQAAELAAALTEG